MSNNTTITNDELFNETNEVKGNWVSWGKVGDWIKATLLDRRTIDSTFNPVDKVVVYDLKMHSGEFHSMDKIKQPVEPAIKVEEGQYYCMSGKTGIDAQMRNIKKGQIIGLKFVELVPSKTKGFNPAKSIKVYTDGTMDEEYLKENTSDDPIFGTEKPF